MSENIGRVEFTCNDIELEQGFKWAKETALSYVRTGTGGPFYEAALPGRNAYCMRDTAHQVIGAEVLGLHQENLNMMRRFCKSISPEKDFCGFWEIDMDGSPCVEDYKNDLDFWYNLPANFDIIDAIWRLYCWTGCDEYLVNPDVQRFCDLSVKEYVHRWDRDGDGLVDALPGEGHRCVPGYCESGDSSRARACLDTLCVQIRAMDDYARLCSLRGMADASKKALDQKAVLETLLKEKWTLPDGGFSDYMTHDRTYVSEKGEALKSACYYGIAEGRDAEAVLNLMAQGMDHQNVENFSHYPETFWRYGREKDAMAALHRAVQPTLPRRTYPELGFSVIGAYATGLMGMKMNEQGVLMSGMGTDELECAQLRHVPIGGTIISLRHLGKQMSALRNEGGRMILWQPHKDGQPISVKPGEEREVSY